MGLRGRSSSLRWLRFCAAAAMSILAGSGCSQVSGGPHEATCAEFLAGTPDARRALLEERDPSFDREGAAAGSAVVATLLACATEPDGSLGEAVLRARDG